MYPDITIIYKRFFQVNPKEQIVEENTKANEDWRKKTVKEIINKFEKDDSKYPESIQNQINQLKKKYTHLEELNKKFISNSNNHTDKSSIEVGSKQRKNAIPKVEIANYFAQTDKDGYILTLNNEKLKEQLLIANLTYKFDTKLQNVINETIAIKTENNERKYYHQLIVSIGSVSISFLSLIVAIIAIIKKST